MTKHLIGGVRFRVVKAKFLPAECGEQWSVYADQDIIGMFERHDGNYRAHHYKNWQQPELFMRDDAAAAAIMAEHFRITH